MTSECQRCGTEFSEIMLLAPADEITEGAEVICDNCGQESGVPVKTAIQ